MSDLIVSHRNFCSDLNLVSRLINPERCLMWAPLSDGIRSRANACRLGVLVTMVDVAGSDPVLAAWSPDWTATQDLSVHAVGSLLEGPVVVDARLERRGKKASFISADIYDGSGVSDLDLLQQQIDATSSCASAGPVLVARSFATFTRIPRTGATGVDSYDPNQWIGTIRRRTSGQDNPDVLDARVGLKILDADSGVVEIDNSPYVANSIGTINGGVQAVVVEAAAECMRPGMVAADIQIHYLSQLKVWPARTIGSVIRDASDHSSVQVKLVDAGAGDKLLAMAVVILQRQL